MTNDSRNPEEIEREIERERAGLADTLDDLQDRFSVEGSNVIIRGLPYVLSTLNGRYIFSANGGRTLSFNDVSPELLGRVEIYKNVSADMIEGNISGLVNLVTRKPLDNPGLNLAGTVEVNYGDLAKEWSPGFSGLISNTFETNVGTFGLQFGYAQQELVTRTDASQITDPCYRADTLDGPCLRVVNVGSGGYFGDPNFDESNFPPPGSVVVPKGAGVRTTDLTRDRTAYSGVGQWESSDGRAVITLEYLRAETEGTLNEFAALALVNDDALFPIPVPGTTPTFDNGIFQTGSLTQPNGYKYEGQWNAGVKEGQGRITYPDGAVYEGTLKGGERDGERDGGLLVPSVLCGRAAAALVTVCKRLSDRQVHVTLTLL